MMNTADASPAKFMNVSFYAGSLHYGWCLVHEIQQVRHMYNVFESKQKKCLFVDVGMNDGFYTNLAAALGCQVYAFEIQRQCIRLAKLVTTRNRFDGLVNIFKHPVSSVNGETISIPCNLNTCSGTFSFSNKNGHQMKLTKVVNFTTVSLDAFIPKGVFIDFLKIDTEGHETMVLQGALGLFASQSIGTVITEINDLSRSAIGFELFKTILSYGYEMSFINCKNKKSLEHKYSLSTFEALTQDLVINRFFLCVDLLITLPPSRSTA